MKWSQLLRSRSIFKFAFILVGSGILCFGQSTGRIGGTVVDASGAIVPGAAAACRNIDTGLTRAVETNQSGLFQCPDLPIGRYNVEVSKGGFQTQRSSDISLVTGQVLDLRLTLQIENAGQTVDVVSEVPLLQTSSSSVQASVTEKQMKDLPLNGRNPLQLVTLAPGATLTDAGTISGQQDNRGLTVNGLRATQNNFRLDGANYNNSFFGSAPILPNPDTLQEFTVQSSAYSANYSGAGALVQLATRSGSNEFHGSAFEFLRNTELNARNFFQLERPPFKLNQYGGTIGGPIKKDRTFFFFSAQDTLQRSAPSPVQFTTPTAAQRQGDFSSVSAKIIDPRTGQPFPGNIIPQDRLDPVAVKLAELYLPLPNRGNNYVSSQNRNIDDTQYLIKIDQVITTNNRLSGRYFLDNNNFQRPFNAPLGFYSANSFRNQSLTLQDTHIFSPRLTATFSGSFGRFARTQVPQAPGLQSLQDLGVQVPQGTPIDVFPGIRANINGYVNIFSGGALQQIPTTFDYHAAATYITGAHTLNFGFDFERDRMFAGDYSYTPGDFAFNGQRTSSPAYPGSGNALADFFLGLPSTFFQDNGRIIDLRESKPALYIQDDWKVNHQLTINLGLRWDPWLPATDKQNTLAGFIPGVQSTVAPGAPLGLVYPGDAGIPNSLFKKDWNNFAPRVGFAWNVGGNSRTVVRGGYGIFYTPVALSIYTRTNSTQPSVLTTNIPNPASFQNPYSNYPGGSPYPRGRIQPDEFGSYQYALPLSGGVLDPGAKTGYSQNWNVTVERQLRSDLALSVAYVGNHGSSILASRQLNPGIYGPGATLANLNDRRLYPGFAAVEIASPYEYSLFHSLQVNATKRTAKGLTLLANYVWSKTIDNTSSTLEGNPGPSNPFNFAHSRGLADFDQTHRFNASAVYDTPHLDVKGFRNVLLNDWQLNVIATLTSGLPFTVTSGTDRSLSGVGSDRADQVGDPSRPDGVDKVQQYFNASAFVPAAIGTFGNVGRNSLRGPGRANVDVSIFKNFFLTESWKLQFRAETFNIQNRANFNNPNASVAAGANFGRILSADDPRVFQFGLKFLF